jgi:hypothetical protein
MIKVRLVLALALCAPACLAQTGGVGPSPALVDAALAKTFFGFKPGASTRAQVQKRLGQPEDVGSASLPDLYPDDFDYISYPLRGQGLSEISFYFRKGSKTVFSIQESGTADLGMKDVEALFGKDYAVKDAKAGPCSDKTVKMPDAARMAQDAQDQDHAPAYIWLYRKLGVAAIVESSGQVDAIERRDFCRK